VDSRTASAISQHAAAACAHELSDLVGPTIFRGRLYDDHQKEALDRALREREMEERNMAPMMKQQQNQTQFSPFEPPGLLDTPYSQKLQPGMPHEFVNPQQQLTGMGNSNNHPGIDDSVSM
jgi:hypothetical protein